MKKQFTPTDKARAALEAIKEIKTTSQIASEYKAHPTQIGKWRKQALKGLPKIFSEKQEKQDQQKLIEELYKIIGKREAELSWLKKKLSPFNSS